MKFFPPVWAIRYRVFLCTEASFRKYPLQHTSLHPGKTSTQKEDKSLIRSHNSCDASTTADHTWPASCWKVEGTWSGCHPRTEANSAIQTGMTQAPKLPSRVAPPTPVNGIATRPPSSPHRKGAGQPVSFLPPQPIGPTCH